MRRLAAILIWSVLIACPFHISSAQGQTGNKRTDRVRNDLLGQVYAVKYWTRFYSERDAKWTDSETHTTDYYDKGGDITQSMTYWAGVATERTTYSRSGSEEVAEKTESIPIAHAQQPGSPASSVRIQKRVFKYDPDGHLTVMELKAEDGTLIQKAEYRYDAQGRVERSISRFGSSRFASTTLFEYDSSRLEKGATYYDNTGQVAGRVLCKYELDSQGNWIRKEFFKPDSTTAYRALARTITYYSPETGQGTLIPGENPNDTLQPRPASTLPKIIRKSGGVLQTSAIKKVEPSYPRSAREAHITGQVIVEITISESGDVSDAHALSGPPELTDAAVAAAKKWKFAPTLLSGVPVKVIGTITFHFEM